MNFNAFPNDFLPSNVEIVRSKLLGDNWEADAVLRLFKGKRRFDITFERITSEYPHDKQSLHHLLTDTAFSFYLPALMKISIEHYYDEFIGLLCDSLTDTLLQMAKGQLNHRLFSLIELYTPTQLSVVAEFLSILHTMDPWPDPKTDRNLQAINLFWGQFKTLN